MTIQWSGSGAWGMGFCLSAILLPSLTGCGDGASDRFLSIGTAGTGGLYYVLGGALASQLTQHDPARQYTAEVTGGSVENVNRVREGQLDLGMVMAISAVEAYYGGADYPTPVEDLRIVAPFYKNVTHVLVGRGSRAQSIRDFRGLSVSVGSAGSGTEQEARQLLAAAGLGYGDVQVRYLSFGESAAALADGAIDAAFISSGYPAGAVLEATTTGGARLIPIGDEVLERLQADHPFYVRGEIPEGVYRGMTQPIPTVLTMNWIVGRADLSAEVVTNLLDVLVERRDALIRVHEMAREIDMNDLADAPIPLHPATEAWFGEYRR